MFTACGIMHPRCYRPVAWKRHFQATGRERLVGCLYYLKLGLFACFRTRPKKYSCVVALLRLLKLLTRVGYIWSDTRLDRHCTASPLDGWAAELGLDRPEA
jgi:hypothetical protein